METQPLADLAYVILERHGAAAEAAVAKILERVRAALPPDRVVGCVYGEREAGRQPLQPGNWVTLGEIAAAGAITFVEVNVTTGVMRERCVWARFRSSHSHLSPPQSLSAPCKSNIQSSGGEHLCSKH